LGRQVTKPIRLDANPRRADRLLDSFRERFGDEQAGHEAAMRAGCDDLYPFVISPAVIEKLAKVLTTATPSDDRAQQFRYDP
jgi:hypothetical protein